MGLSKLCSRQVCITRVGAQHKEAVPVASHQPRDTVHSVPAVAQ